jgi:hypothetical protein
MDMTEFLIFVAPLIVLVVSVVLVFVWGAKAGPPAFIENTEQTEYKNSANEEKYTNEKNDL